MEASAGVSGGRTCKSELCQDMELSNRDVKLLRDGCLQIHAASRHTHTMRPSQ